jgi:arginyl-tRNA synthetase
LNSCVQGDDGKKFKTRSGSSVRLADLMDEAVYRCAKELKQRYSSDKEKASEENILSDEEIEKAAESMGYSAIKYFDLKQNRNSNYKFSYDKMLDPKGNLYLSILLFQNFTSKLTVASFLYFFYDNKFKFSCSCFYLLGNTAVYLLYTYARICSIFRKKKIIVKNIDTSYLKVTEQSERELVLQMLKFNDIIQSVSEDFYIHRFVHQ